MDNWKTKDRERPFKIVNENLGIYSPWETGCFIIVQVTKAISLYWDILQRNFCCQLSVHIVSAQ